MTAWRRAFALTIESEDLARLQSIARSRTEPASRVERARMLLAYRDDPSFFAVSRALGVHHQTVQRCIERAVAYDPIAALDDRPRPGREPTITAEAKAWVVALACRKAKELGYPHEVWTTRLLARHVREHGPAAGHACLAKLVQGTVCKILGEQEVKAHKVRYYLERRDPAFKEKMAQVLCVYRQVKVLKKQAHGGEVRLTRVRWGICIDTRRVIRRGLRIEMERACERDDRSAGGRDAASCAAEPSSGAFFAAGRRARAVAGYVSAVGGSSASDLCDDCLVR